MPELSSQLYGSLPYPEGPTPYFFAVARPSVAESLRVGGEEYSREFSVISSRTESFGSTNGSSESVGGGEN